RPSPSKSPGLTKSRHDFVSLPTEFVARTLRRYGAVAASGFSQERAPLVESICMSAGPASSVHVIGATPARSGMSIAYSDPQAVLASGSGAITGAPYVTEMASVAELVAPSRAVT